MRSREKAEALSEAISCGIRSAGADVIRNDSRFFAEASFAGDLYGAAMSVFVEEAGEQIRIRFAGRARTAPSHDIERKLNTAVRSATPTQGKIRFGSDRFAIGTALAYETELQRMVAGRAVKVRIQADNLPGRCSALFSKGAVVLTTLRMIISRSVLMTGQSCTWSTRKAIGLRGYNRSTVTACPLQRGHKVCSVSFDAAQVLEMIAVRENARIARRGRDDDYWEHVGDSLFLRDALIAAIKLCGYLCKTGQKVVSLCKEIPDFQVVSRHYQFAGDRGQLMRTLSAVSSRRELGDGIRFPMREGWVHVSPDSSRQAIRVIAESVSVEAAEELCADIHTLIKENDL